jgi:hypothetical protein
LFCRNENKIVEFEREASTCLLIENNERLCSRSFASRFVFVIDPNCKIIRFAFWRCEGCALVARNYGVPTIAHALSGDVDGLLSICLMFDAMINHSKIAL